MSDAVFVKQNSQHSFLYVYKSFALTDLEEGLPKANDAMLFKQCSIAIYADIIDSAKDIISKL